MMAGMTPGGGNAQAVNNPMGSPFDNILGSDWNGLAMGGQQNQDPLSNLMDSVNSLDPLNSMGKSLNEQVLLRHSFIHSFIHQFIHPFGRCYQSK